MRILGVDPGLRATGYGVIEVSFKTSKNKPILLGAGVIRTQPKNSLFKRVASIYRQIKEILEEYRPKVVVLEELYSHNLHPSTAILIGHARGVISLAAEEKKIPIVGYTSSRIKKALLGQGAASKGQLQRMVQNLLKLSQPPKPQDTSDALALALAHASIKRGILK